MRDDSVRAVIVADGPHFSSGHELRDRTTMSDFEPVTQAAASTSRPSAGWRAPD